ncbi:hypothetical protein ACYSNM_08660 [Myroides sp. LJL116]
MAKNNKPITTRGKKVKILFKIMCFFIVIPVLLLAWYDQSRTFYCVSNDKCVTVWKRLGGKCYIIPSKYYGVFKPSENYIKATNTQYLTLYFSNDIPNKMIVRDQGNSMGKGEKYEIVNNLPEELEINDYSDDYNVILYKSDAVKFKDVKTSTEYIDLNIFENYATDKNGNTFN